MLPVAPPEAIASGAGGDVDVLIGCNTEEFRYFLVPVGAIDAVTAELSQGAVAAYGLDPDVALRFTEKPIRMAGPGDLLAAVGTDWFYRIPAIRLAEAHSETAGDAPTPTNSRWQPPTFDGRLGACHTAEIPFVFDNLGLGGFENVVEHARRRTWPTRCTPRGSHSRHTAIPAGRRTPFVTERRCASTPSPPCRRIRMHRNGNCGAASGDHACPPRRVRPRAGDHDQARAPLIHALVTPPKTMPSTGDIRYAQRTQCLQRGT